VQGNQTNAKGYIVSLTILFSAIIAGYLLGLELLYILAVSACLIFITARYAPLQSVIAAALCYAAEATLYASPIGWIGVLTIIPSITMGVLLRRKRTMPAILVGGLVGYILSVGGMLLAFQYVFDMQWNLQAEIFALFSESIKNVSETYGGDTQLQQEMLSLITKILPAVAIFCVAAVSYFSFLIARAALRRTEDGFDYFKPFTAIRADKVSTIVFIILFISNMFVNNDTVSVVLLNMFILIGAMLWLCGLSLAWFYIQHFRSALARVFAVAVLVLASPIIMYTQIGLGCIDAFFNFRTRKKAE